MNNLRHILAVAASVLKSMHVQMLVSKGRNCTHKKMLHVAQSRMNMTNGMSRHGSWRGTLEVGQKTWLWGYAVNVRKNVGAIRKMRPMISVTRREIGVI